MTEMKSVLALRPGAKLSKADRDTLKEAGIIVVRVDPDDLVAIDGARILPSNEMLRCALDTINNANAGGYSTALRADFAKRMIAAYLAFGEAKEARAAVVSGRGS